MALALGYVCDICSGGLVGNPAMVLNVLYIGVASCREYYKAGINGFIPVHLCDVLKLYAFRPCGCYFNHSRVKTFVESNGFVS